MILLRRWLVLITLAFWQGGFVFYGAVVVPIGAEVLGSHAEQARITRPVTHYLNIAGSVALAAWCWDGVAARRRVGRGRWFWAGWAFLLLLLAAQVGLHAWLDHLLDFHDVAGTDHGRFSFLHRVYLLASTAQWLGAIALLAATVHSWRRVDRSASN